MEINKVAQVGAGYMGGGIAQSLANAGFQVRLADVDADATRKAHERLLAEAEQFQAQGLFPPGSTDRIRENLHVAPSIEEAVADVDFVEEAVPEVPGIKRDVLARVEAAAQPGTIIGTNTSTIPVHVLAEGMKDPSRFLTVHWSNPAPFIPGVEIVAGDRTDPRHPRRRADAGAGRPAQRAGRRRTGLRPEPLQYVLLKEAMTIVEEGVATATDIDTIVTSTFGFRLPFFGPFAIADMAGLDVYANGFTTLEEAFGERLAAPKVLTDLVAQGKFGVKSGIGLPRARPGEAGCAHRVPEQGLQRDERPAARARTLAPRRRFVRRTDPCAHSSTTARTTSASRTVPIPQPGPDEVLLAHHRDRDLRVRPARLHRREQAAAPRPGHGPRDGGQDRRRRARTPSGERPRTGPRRDRQPGDRLRRVRPVRRRDASSCVPAAR